MASSDFEEVRGEVDCKKVRRVGSGWGRWRESGETNGRDSMERSKGFSEFFEANG